ncbi:MULTISPECIES: helix-turn-helix domain-containing protein [Flammeovirga]|uniref:Helix-turn-helix domain-containing protein n=1 Tax=Flammeovirga agarivorans TaxID=2726742 RepID=A0A7X8SL55_9BACT|nr:MULTISPECIES: AraC family transcriptional regulator [Flammeovirga]NLR92137.1 helix-turn-helix domain-containing protein [Flammeovirga agarivorans]
MQVEGRLDEFLRIELITKDNHHILQEKFDTEKTVLWFQDDNTRLNIDSVPYHFKKDQVITFTELYKIEVVEMGEAKMFQFNRSFYCIVEHDSDVDCKGILFFGAKHLPEFSLDDDDKNALKYIWEMMLVEMSSKKYLHMPMLQSLMKQVLIVCTRNYKSQNNIHEIEKGHMDIIRQFTFLVEKNFKELFTVADYADLLHKSPKTLSNVFSKNGYKAPLQIIQERRILEARRLLQYSSCTISEVAFDLGFSDIQTFNRFFKRHKEMTPSAFKQKYGK